MVSLAVSSQLCNGCLVCIGFCSLFHEDAVWPERSRVKILSEKDTGPYIPNICRQCEDAPCAAACPLRIITFNDETGAWEVDTEECAGCNMCVEACPHGAIVVDEDLCVALKCDLCSGKPECALVCPTGAITLRSKD